MLPFMDLQALLDDLAVEAAPLAAQGKVADYIPALASVPAARFGLALATTDGQLFGTGDWRTPFSIQSVSKAFSLAQVLARDGEALWTRVGREPSGNPFNSLVQLEYEKGIPRNPFINAGALVLIYRLLTLTGDSLGTLRDFLRAESGNPAVDVDAEVAASEASHGHRNAALAHFMASCGNLENPVDRVLDHYVRQCSLRMSCADLAKAALPHLKLSGGGALIVPTEEIRCALTPSGQASRSDATPRMAYTSRPGRSPVTVRSPHRRTATRCSCPDSSLSRSRRN